MLLVGGSSGSAFLFVAEENSSDLGANAIEVYSEDVRELWGHTLQAEAALMAGLCHALGAAESMKVLFPKIRHHQICCYDTIGETYATINPTTSTWHHRR
jgi:hypothetical protein